MTIISRYEILEKEKIDHGKRIYEKDKQLKETIKTIEEIKRENGILKDQNISDQKTTHSIIKERDNKIKMIEIEKIEQEKRIREKDHQLEETITTNIIQIEEIKRENASLKEQIDE